MPNTFVNLIIALQQLLLAGTFVIITLTARSYGDRAQQVAEQAVENQGLGTEKDFLKLIPLDRDNPK